MKTISIAALCTSAALAGGAVAATLPAHGADRPARTASAGVDPSRFTHPVGNPYYPLRPGLVTRLRGSDGPQRYRERVLVTHQTKTIQGVRARVVLDTLRRLDGSVAEKTHDWYAGDNDGNVWYFGEDTATYDRHGHVRSREGSWQAGVDGARAGLIMPADPRPTDAYRQEFQHGSAEDQGWIVQRTAVVHTPYRRFHDAVRGFEWSRLEPGVVSQKFYGKGVGIISEEDVAGGHESFELVAVHRP